MHDENRLEPVSKRHEQLLLRHDRPRHPAARKLHLFPGERVLHGFLNEHIPDCLLHDRRQHAHRDKWRAVFRPGDRERHHDPESHCLPERGAGRQYGHERIV